MRRCGGDVNEAALYVMDGTARDDYEHVQLAKARAEAAAKEDERLSAEVKARLLARFDEIAVPDAGATSSVPTFKADRGGGSTSTSKRQVRYRDGQAFTLARGMCFGHPAWLAPGMGAPTPVCARECVCVCVWFWCRREVCDGGRSPARPFHVRYHQGKAQGRARSRAWLDKVALRVCVRVISSGTSGTKAHARTWVETYVAVHGHGLGHASSSMPMLCKLRRGIIGGGGMCIGTWCTCGPSAAGEEDVFELVVTVG
ncbi:hypothetical protein EON66_10235 [archaeon]|nr:MAG: hypothetical protein EON66_10235 [archaeon]